MRASSVAAKRLSAFDQANCAAECAVMRNDARLTNDELMPKLQGRIATDCFGIHNSFHIRHSDFVIFYPYKSSRRCAKDSTRLRTESTSSSDRSAAISSSRSADAAATTTPRGSMIAELPQNHKSSSL